MTGPMGLAIAMNYLCKQPPPFPYMDLHPFHVPACPRLISQCSLHWRQRNTYLGKGAGNAAARRIIRSQTGDCVALEGESEMFLREGDPFACGWNRRHSGHGYNEVACVRAGDLNCCYHLVTLLYFVVGVERPVLEGILKCALNGKELLFAYGLRYGASEDEIV